MSTAWEEAAPVALRALSDEHAHHLIDTSGLDPDVIDGRGYYSLDLRAVATLVEAGVLDRSIMKAESWLGIPIIRPDGVEHGHMIRVFGGAVKHKYIWPTGSRQAADVHPTLLDKLRNPDIPLLVGEGIKKGDALLSAARREGIDCVPLNLNGCWGWRAKVEGGSIALPDFHDIPLHDRKVFVISDSDFRTNDDVRGGWSAAASYFESKTGEHRTWLVVVPQPGLEKHGADDYLLAGGGVEALLALAATPKQALLDTTGERPPLTARTARVMIAEAGTEIPHLVHPLIPEQAIVLLAGHTSTLKTWHALTLCLDGAFGLPWLDHPELTTAEPFTSLYVNKEMGGAILGDRLKRLARDARYKDRPDFDAVIDERLFFVDEAELDLAVPSHRDRLEELIADTGAKLVVLDSLSMCWTGDENSNAEVGAFYVQLRGIIQRTGSTFVPLHHLVKPQTGGRSKTSRQSQTFSVRGAGQIAQQADAALHASLYVDDRGMEGERREIVLSQAKARTAVELPAFISEFSDNDGAFMSIRYAGRLAEARARSYAESHGDPDKRDAWVLQSLIDMPAMDPTGPGMRTRQVLTLLQQAWPEDVGQTPPHENTFRRSLDALVESGVLELVERNKKIGDLYRLDDGTTDEGEHHARAARPAPSGGD